MSRSKLSLCSSRSAWLPELLLVLPSTGCRAHEPGHRLALGEAGFGREWVETQLSQFAATDGFAGILSMAEAVSLLGHLAGETVFQPESEEAPVQVMGALEIGRAACR